MSMTQAIFDVLSETVWPTRCIVCGAPGTVLCPTCMSNLPFIDQWLACPRCGAPYGRWQCTECNTYSLREAGFDRIPFEACVSAVVFDDASARIVRGRKDAGERRLDEAVAYLIASAVPPEWVCGSPCVCAVPASSRARRERGFDHAAALAQATARLLDVPFETLLAGASDRDQRALRRIERFSNMRGSFAYCSAHVPHAAILVDDVYTTGATLMAASEALLAGGVRQVHCATFAHVYRN